MSGGRAAGAATLTAFTLRPFWAVLLCSAWLCRMWMHVGSPCEAVSCGAHSVRGAVPAPSRTARACLRDRKVAVVENGVSEEGEHE